MTLTPLELAEVVLLAMGVLMVIVTAAVLHRRRAWRWALDLPSPPAHRLTGADALLGVLCVVLLPSMFYGLLNLRTPFEPTSGPAANDIPSAAQTLAMALGQLASAAVLYRMVASRWEGGRAAWGLTWTGWSRRFWQAVSGYLAVWPACFGLLYATRGVVHWVAPDYRLPEHASLRLLRSGQMPLWLEVVTAASALVLAPVVEELMFRGVLLPVLARAWGRTWPAVVASGCAFGVFHHALWYTAPSLAIFGIVLGWLYCRTGSLTLAIFLHAVFNAKTLLWLALGAE